MIITFIACMSFHFDIAVIGASGNLGREIVYQSISEYDKNVIGLTSKPTIFYKPCRTNSFNPSDKQVEFKSSKLVLDNYWNHIHDNYKHLILCTSAKPFEKDYSDELLKNFLDNLSQLCESISLVSAFGTGDSLKDGNVGIQVMDNFYLKDVYRAKNVQEQLLSSYSDKNVKKFVYRPKALSYGKTFIQSTPRYTLAKEILKDIFT